MPTQHNHSSKTAKLFFGVSQLASFGVFNSRCPQGGTASRPSHVPIAVSVSTFILSVQKKQSKSFLQELNIDFSASQPTSFGVFTTVSSPVVLTA